MTSRIGRRAAPEGHKRFAVFLKEFSHVRILEI
jgi:hypothetical protein